MQKKEEHRKVKRPKERRKRRKCKYCYRLSGGCPFALYWADSHALWLRVLAVIWLIWRRLYWTDNCNLGLLFDLHKNLWEFCEMLYHLFHPLWNQIDCPHPLNPSGINLRKKKPLLTLELRQTYRGLQKFFPFRLHLLAVIEFID